MNLRDLEYIVSMADLGSMAKAADRCHVSQSTLSIQLKKLEAELGVAIFERAHRCLTITPAGRHILELARGIVRDSQSLRELARTSRDPLVGAFRLGVFPTLAPYYLPYVMPKLLAAFPQLELRLIEEKSPTLAAKLTAADLDASLASIPFDGGPFEFTDLFDDPFLLACRNDHPLARRRSITQEDLRREPLLLLDEGHCMRHQALDVCHMAKAREHAEFRATSLETLRQMVVAGTGITLMPKIAALPTPGLVYVPFAGAQKPSRRIGLAWRPSHPRKATLEAVAVVLKKAGAPKTVV